MLRVALTRPGDTKVSRSIRREVDTRGWLAADTHVHTKTHSGHGDIDMQERMVALAGEGVEIAVATDHNHHTDYRPAVEDVELEGAFLPITGNEVSTPIGHFNAFPLDPEEAPPKHELKDWVKQLHEIRSADDVRVVILNHPRRSGGMGFERLRLNPLSGEAHSGPERLGIDAVEIVNAKTLHDDRMLTVRDWFALLNRGHRVAAVGASDSHSVDEIVGQGRTYVASATDDPAEISVDEVCDSFLRGRLVVSLGLLAEVRVDGRYSPGDLATPSDDYVIVKVRVQGPSWTRADAVALYLNGVEERRVSIRPRSGPVKYEATWILEPGHDAHLVVVASGPAVTAPYWPIRGGEKKSLLSVTNPVWIDGDRDGKFTPAFEYAAALVWNHGWRGPGLERALARHDRAVAVQFASLARARVEARLREEYARIVRRARKELAEILSVEDAGVSRAIADYEEEAPEFDVAAEGEER